MQSSWKSILLSGWGLFLGIAGIFSVALDLAAPSVQLSNGTSFPLFRGGSFTLGWLTIAGLMIVPAGVMRSFGFAPLSKVFAIVWCLVAFFLWVASHEIYGPVDPNNPPKPNLAIFAGLVLCWRLLTRRDELPKPTSP